MGYKGLQVVAWRPPNSVQTTPVTVPKPVSGLTKVLATPEHNSEEETTEVVELVNAVLATQNTPDTEALTGAIRNVLVCHFSRTWHVCAVPSGRLEMAASPHADEYRLEFKGTTIVLLDHQAPRMY